MTWYKVVLRVGERICKFMKMNMYGRVDIVLNLGFNIWHLRSEVLYQIIVSKVIMAWNRGVQIFYEILFSLVFERLVALFSPPFCFYMDILRNIWRYIHVYPIHNKQNIIFGVHPDSSCHSSASSKCDSGWWSSQSWILHGMENHLNTSRSQCDSCVSCKAQHPMIIPLLPTNHKLQWFTNDCLWNQCEGENYNLFSLWESW